MDIIDSFIKQDQQFNFIEISADASKKKFFTIKNNKNILIMQITTLPGSCDEDFENGPGEYSQYFYFKHSFHFLEKIGNIPRIIATDNDRGLILLQHLGNIRLKDYLEMNPDCDKYIYDSMNWLIKLHQINFVDNILSERLYDLNAMRKEVERFIKWTLKYANNYDIFVFNNGIENILAQLKTRSIVYNHRDFHPRNIMIHDNKIYIIDTQDMCIGPNYCDLVSLLFNPNFLFSMNKRKKYIEYFHKMGKIHEPFDSFYKKIINYAVIRVLKSYGWHSQYFMRDMRWLSQEQIRNNQKTLQDLSKITGNNPVFDIINKHKIIPVILCAGLGIRMNQPAYPKTLCEINGRPMLFYILDAVVKLNPARIIIVVGHQKEMIIEKTREYPYKNIEFIVQPQAMGTGHAVMQCQKSLEKFNGQLLILFGDKPLITTNTLENLVIDFFKHNLDAGLLSYLSDYSHKQTGRIIRNSKKEITQIYEDVDEKYPSNEFAGGVQMYNSKKLFECIYHISNNNNKNEYYLGDVVSVMYNKKYLIGSTITNNNNELMNVNTKAELEYAKKLLNY